MTRQEMDSATPGPRAAGRVPPARPAPPALLWHSEVLSYGTSPYFTYVQVYYLGHDRPLVAIAAHVVSGGGNLAVYAAEARGAVCQRYQLDPDTVLWINHFGGARGSYSRRSERFAIVDFAAPKTGPFHNVLASTPTTRREIKRRFGIAWTGTPPRFPDPGEAAIHCLRVAGSTTEMSKYEICLNLDEIALLRIFRDLKLTCEEALNALFECDRQIREAR